MPEVSTLRLHLLRFLYLGNLVGVGYSAWPGLLAPEEPLDPVRGVAFCFWAALSGLSALGLRYPLQMLPLLFLQLLYKTLWLVAVWLPLRAAGETTGLTGIMIAGLAADLVLIPWPYVWTHYASKRGDRWRG